MTSDISNIKGKLHRKISRELEYINYAKYPQNNHSFQVDYTDYNGTKINQPSELEVQRKYKKKKCIP